ATQLGPKGLVLGGVGEVHPADSNVRVLMDFTFSAEQDQLRDAVRAFLADKAPSAYVRSMMEDARGITDDVWSQLVELGWTEITDLVDLTVVLEEMGKLPFPGPYLSAAVLAPMAARRLGAEELLGSGLGTIAL